MKRIFNFETYLLGPNGETGWDIHFISVYAQDMKEAKDTLSNYPDFDCIILFNRSFMPDETDSTYIAAGYTMWRTDENYIAEYLN